MSEDAHDLFLIRRQDESNSILSDLLLACRCGDRLIVEQQLSAHTDVNGNEGGTTALIESLAHEHFEIAKLLLNRGADVRATSNSRWTALHLVASLGPEALAKDIVAMGADVNARTDLGLTPLMMAARRRRPRMVELLIGSGGAIETADSVGATALVYAAEGDQDESGGDPESIRLLVAAGANVNVQGDAGMTPLMLVAFHNDLDSVRLLLQKRADLNVRDAQGRTALGVAEYAKNDQVVQALHSAGAAR
jgi:ankyrin repeat protein